MSFKPHTCKKCPDKKFKSPHSLQYHEQAVHQNVKYTCSICEYEATKKSSLKVHIQAVHLGVTHACPDCGTKFTMKSNLKKHFKNVHSPEFTFSE